MVSECTGMLCPRHHPEGRPVTGRLKEAGVILDLLLFVPAAINNSLVSCAAVTESRIVTGGVSLVKTPVEAYISRVVQLRSRFCLDGRTR